MKRYLLHIVLHLVFYSSLISQSEIVNTYNLYFTSADLSIDQDCLKQVGPSGGNWGKVNQNGEYLIICGERFDAWDYNVFEFFSQYQDFIPTDLISRFENEFLFNKNEQLDPAIIKDFFTHLRQYIVSDFDSSKYYYIVYDEIYKNEEFKFFFVWERVTIGEKQIKIRTRHTTYDKNEKHGLNFDDWKRYNNHYEVVHETTEKESEWLKIPKDNKLSFDDKTLLFEQVFYSSFLLHRIDKILAISQLAMERGLKMKRNSDWF